MLKKALYLILSAALLMSVFAGCAKQKQPNDTDASSTVTTTAEPNTSATPTTPPWTTTESTSATETTPPETVFVPDYLDSSAYIPGIIINFYSYDQKILLYGTAEPDIYVRLVDRAPLSTSFLVSPLYSLDNYYAYHASGEVNSYMVTFGDSVTMTIGEAIFGEYITCKDLILSDLGYIGITLKFPEGEVPTFPDAYVPDWEKIRENAIQGYGIAPERSSSFFGVNRKMLLFGTSDPDVLLIKVDRVNYGTSEDLFYTDEYYNYFGTGDTRLKPVTFEDGTTMTVGEALDEGLITGKDLVLNDMGNLRLERK